MLPIAVLGARHDLHAIRDLRLRGCHQCLDFSCRVGGTLGERAHFLCHDREAAAAIAGPCRLDTGVQRQEISLERDLVDRADDMADLLGRCFDIGHRGDGPASHFSALLYRLARGGNRLLGDPRLLRIVSDIRGDCLQRRSGLAQLLRLSVGTSGVVTRSRCECGDYGFCSRGLLIRCDHRRLQRFDCSIQGIGEALVGPWNFSADARGQVPLGKGTDRRAEHLLDFGAFALALFGKLPVVLDAQLVETQRHRDLDIDHDDTNDGIRQFGKFVGASPAGRQEFAARKLIENAGEQMLEHDTMTCDMPTRIETHLAFAVGEDLDALGVEPVEPGIGQNIPVGAQQIVEAFKLAFTGEISRGVGKGLEALEDIPEAGLETWLKHGAVASEKIAKRLLKAGKAQPVTQAACL